MSGLEPSGWSQRDTAPASARRLVASGRPTPSPAASSAFYSPRTDSFAHDEAAHWVHARAEPAVNLLNDVAVRNRLEYTVVERDNEVPRGSNEPGGRASGA